MRVFLTLVSCLALSSAALAQEWTRFRGPNGSGISAAPLPERISESNYAWKTSLPGIGHSSPVLWANRLFVTACDKASATRILLGLDADSGAILWKREFAGKPFKMNADNAYAASTPAVDEQRVYLAWTAPDSSRLMAFTHDGKDVWQFELPNFTSQHGCAASPIVFEDLLIFPFDQEGKESFVIALDRASGQVRWKTPRTSTSAAASTPCLYQPAGQPAQLILTSRSAGMAAYDPRTGKLLWQMADVMDRRVCASPVVAGNLLLSNCGEGPNGRVLVAIQPGAADQPPKLAYKLTTSIPYVPTPLYKANRIFHITDTGTVACLDAATGKAIWQERLGAPFYCSPVIAGERLYAVSKKGELFILSATDTYQLFSRHPLGESSFASPAVANNRLYLRTFSQVICLK